MARQPKRSQTSFRKELMPLLEERGISQRELGRRVGMAQSYISRAIHSVRPPSMRLLGKVARALELPEDYFPEFREQAVIEAAKRDPILRDRLYDVVKRSRRK